MGAALVGVLTGQLDAELALHALRGHHMGAAPAIADKLYEVIPAPTQVVGDESSDCSAL